MRNGNGETRPRGGRWTWTALGALAALAAAPAAAQDEFDGRPINYTIYGGTAFDGYETNIQIIGGTVRPAGTGLRPMAGLSVYRLGYRNAGASTNVFAVNPSVGGGWFTPDGQVSAMVGYSFVNEDVPVPVFGGGGGSSGLTTAVQGLYWGADPDVEAIAAYSWEPEYLWTNAVVAQPVMAMGNGTLSLGVDGVYETQMIENGTSAYSLGPAVRWSNDLNLGVTLAGGYRKAEARDATWYVRLGAAFYQ
ncbi:MAG TPA: hypothetical protein VHG08_14960 [Longimicrobium sp.]|nr:hypothetical protein [Longimicrobium sp.]